MRALQAIAHLASFVGVERALARVGLPLQRVLEGAHSEQRVSGAVAGGSASSTNVGTAPATPLRSRMPGVAA